jgi:hypothetical protein
VLQDLRGVQRTGERPKRSATGGLLVFERMKLRRTLSEIISKLKLSADTLYLFQRGIDEILPEMKRRKLDPTQACMMLISNALVRGATNGALRMTQEEEPLVYAEMKVLWVFCGECVLKDHDRFAPVWVVAGLKGSPFDEVEK